jgi:hypothetical protein
MQQVHPASHILIIRKPSLNLLATCFIYCVRFDPQTILVSFILVELVTQKLFSFSTGSLQLERTKQEEHAAS